MFSTLSVSSEHEVGKLGRCSSAVGSQLRRKRQMFLSKPPPAAVFQSPATGIFPQEFSLSAQVLTVVQKNCLILVLLRSNPVTAF